MYFCNLLYFLCKFNSPQVKQNLISRIINFLKDLPNDLPIDLRPRILGNEEMKWKSWNWVEAQALQFPLQKLIVAKSGQNLQKSRYHSFLALPNFAWFFYLWPNILSLIVATLQFSHLLFSRCFYFNNYAWTFELEFRVPSLDGVFTYRSQMISTSSWDTVATDGMCSY